MEQLRLKTTSSIDAFQILTAIASGTNLSFSAHIPTEAVMSRFRREERGEVKRQLKILARSGYIMRHPTRGGLTWNLTRRGLVILLGSDADARQIASFAEM